MVAWTKDNRKKPVGARCEAKKRDGSLCQNWAMPNGRCRLHGGKAVPAPKGSQRALKHGLYAKGFINDELKILPHIRLGNIDDEIKLLKIKLRRAWTAQRMWEEKHKEIQEKAKGDDNQIEGFVRRSKRRLTRSLNKPSIDSHYRLESVETTVAKVHDREGVEHTNRSVKAVTKKEDYSQEIKHLTRLISNLEATRAKDLGGSGSEGLRSLVEEFREFSNEAAETLPGGEM